MSSKKMKVGIVGSRNYPDKRDITSFISNVLLDFSNEIQLVSGGCGKGVDAWVSGYASIHETCCNVSLKEFKPEFEENPEKDYDVQDYHKRNRKIAEYCDVVFAFQYNNSKGTQSTVDKCREVGTPVFVYEYKGEDSDE